MVDEWKLGKVNLAVLQCLRYNDCCHCYGCPYNTCDDFGCRARLRDDILELLKPHEPRLLTFNEVQQNSSMWLETHGWVGDDVHETVLRTDEDRYDYSDVITQFVDQEGGEIICAKDRYNIEWRCWTSEPMESQRKAEKWSVIE